MINDDRLLLKENVINFIRKNPFYKHAAWSIGKSEDTLRNWRNEDDDFSARCEIARAVCLSSFVRRSSPDFILTHADRETFTPHEQKIDLTVNSQLTDEQLDKLITAKLRKTGVAGVAQGEGEKDTTQSSQILEATQ